MIRRVWIVSVIFYLFFEYTNAMTGSDTLSCTCPKKDSADFKPYNYDEALKYAPIFWFADQEEYLPILPFFWAFDGRDNNQNAKRDWEDDNEIAPEAAFEKNGTHAFWDELKAQYYTLPLPEKKKLVTIFYNVDSVKTSTLQKILYSDEQFYRRLNRQTRAYLKNSKDDYIKVYQYYFYCIQDSGLQGHPEDLERVFIFVAPKDLFFIAVGVGHSSFVPNNVLFYTREQLISERLHVLVELGGHSNAPDIDGDGVFEPGIDANWHIENLWGTRDVQAISGLGATGKYASWMNFTRKLRGEASKIFYPSSHKSHGMSNHCYRLVPVQLFRDLHDFIKTHAEDFSVKSENANHGKITRKELEELSIRTALELERIQNDLKELGRLNLTPEQKSEILTNAEKGLNLFFIQQQIEEKLATIKIAEVQEAALHDSIIIMLPKLSFDPMISVAPISVQLNENHLKRMSAWNEGLLVRSRAPALRFWNGLSFGVQQETQSFHDRDFTYPEWRVGLLLRPLGKRPMRKIIDGVFELHFGFSAPRFHSRPKFQNRSLNIFFDRYYNNLISLYFSYSQRSRNWERYASVYGAGFSFTVPYNPVLKPENILRNFRLRLGVGFENHKFARNRFFPMLEFGIHTHRIPPSNQEYIIESTKHRKIWEHKDYDDPEQVFKPHLFRPRHPWAFGIWSSWHEWKNLWPSEENRLSWVVPAWDALPVKLDGILEFQAGFLRSVKRQRPAGAVIGMYYDRFYAARLPSWYLNLMWTDIWGRGSYYSLGGGFSVAVPSGWPLLHLIRARLGLRTDFNQETYRLTQHRIELQIGVQY